MVMSKQNIEMPRPMYETISRASTSVLVAALLEELVWDSTCKFDH
jgi:hypothetical protein